MTVFESSDLADLVYQDGCKFLFVDGLWFRLGDDLFDNPPSSVERLENDESACHRWLRLKVSFIHILQHRAHP